MGLMRLQSVWCALAFSAALAAADDTGKVEVKRHPKVRLAGVTVGAGYSRFSGYYPYWYDPFFYPAWYGPGYWPMFYPGFFHPGFYNGFSRGPHMGEVRLDTVVKSAEVYLDGAYAGTAGERRSMWLDSGVYELEVKAASRQPFQRKIYVLTGKTLKITAPLASEERKP